MDRDEMVRIDEAITDAIGAGDLGALDALMSPELAADFKKGIGEIREAFPDYACTEAARVVQGDRLAVRFDYQGTHRGEWLGVPATGQRVTFRGMSLDRFADGVMVESDVVMDWLDVLEQLGGHPRTDA
ncbi:SnoaL-like polyketide cyclase [Kribbella sp. VKM Ac-2569]|uniref:ester cyclase n=1 Tax=Kribbella sp. VKM Ac-2569 TaxID=2512220 RepID=UPI00102C3F1D|nr:ester cyclase [Kribbella sp. VKM Ac-2569]RZT20077.1 SnoaL-like polyketide cyclase [Kribbella sp. VKM Ac-2569]